MAVWTAPTTRSTGVLVSASIWNTDIVENLKYLKDSPVFDGDISVGDDLFLTSTGAVINFASGDITITHSTNTLTFAGAASGYAFQTGIVSSAEGLAIAATKRLYLDGVAGTGNTYLVEGAADRIDFIAGGTNAVQIGSTAISSNVDVNIAATKRLYLDGGVDTYIYEQAGNTIDTVVANVVAIRASNTVGVQIFPASGGVPLLDSTGFAMTTWPTTVSAANAQIANGNYIRLVSSLRQSKYDIERIPSDVALQTVMKLRGVTFRSAVDDDKRLWAGFIAEEVEQANPTLATYTDGGALQSVTYDRVAAYLVAVVQQQQAEIDALKARIH
jgi:hypothetical protein